MLADGIGPPISANAFFTASVFLGFLAVNTSLDGTSSFAEFFGAGREQLDTESSVFFAFLAFTIYALLILRVCAALLPSHIDRDAFYSRNVFAFSVVILGFCFMNLMPLAPAAVWGPVQLWYFLLGAYTFMVSVTRSSDRVLPFFSPLLYYLLVVGIGFSFFYSYIELQSSMEDEQRKIAEDIPTTAYCAFSNEGLDYRIVIKNSASDPLLIEAVELSFPFADVNVPTEASFPTFAPDSEDLLVTPDNGLLVLDAGDLGEVKGRLDGVTPDERRSFAVCRARISEGWVRILE